jgi:hypothetical protein
MEEIVRNSISEDGMREVRVVSDAPVSVARMRRFLPGAARGLEVVRCYPTSALGLFYGEVVYPVREVVEFPFAACREGKFRRLAVWRLVPEEGFRVSEVIEFLAEWFFVQTHRRAGYVFMRRLPREAISGQQLAVSAMGGEGLVLLEADWALDRCVLVGGIS